MRCDAMGWDGWDDDDDDDDDDEDDDEIVGGWGSGARGVVACDSRDVCACVCVYVCVCVLCIDRVV